MSAKHLTVSNTPEGSYRMHCAICGLSLDIVPPVPMATALRAMRQFEKNHQHKAATAATAGGQS